GRIAMDAQFLDIHGGDVARSELEALEERAGRTLALLRTDAAEARFPLGFEFSGSPKAGKSSIIGLVGLFFRRMGFRVSSPPEGASIETPPDLKDDLVSFNVWCGCYAIQNILARSHESDAADLLLLDRGLFDLTVWLEFLQVHERVIAKQVAAAIADF